MKGVAHQTSGILPCDLTLTGMNGVHAKPPHGVVSRIDRGGGQVGVAEQDLDDANVDAALELMGREAIAQRMWSDPFVDARRISRIGSDPVNLPLGNRLQVMLTREQPPVGMHHALLSADLPPLAEEHEQILRQYGVAVPAALATLQPALAAPRRRGARFPQSARRSGRDSDR